MSDLRKRIAGAIFDPGATQGFKGDRDLTTWQTDAVMAIVNAEINDMSERFRAVNVGRALEQMAPELRVAAARYRDLRSALEPFAKEAKLFEYVKDPTAILPVSVITVADLRIAKAVFEATAPTSNQAGVDHE